MNSAPAAATFGANHPVARSSRVTSRSGFRLGFRRRRSSSVVRRVRASRTSGPAVCATRATRSWRRYVDALAAIGPSTSYSRTSLTSPLGPVPRPWVGRPTETAGSATTGSNPGLLNAAEFGVPQIRRRAVVFGSLRDPAQDRQAIWRRAPARAWATVRSAIGDLASESTSSLYRETRTSQDGHLCPGPSRPPSYTSAAGRRSSRSIGTPRFHLGVIGRRSRTICWRPAGEVTRRGGGRYGSDALGQAIGHYPDGVLEAREAAISTRRPIELSPISRRRDSKASRTITSGMDRRPTSAGKSATLCPC